MSATPSVADRGIRYRRLASLWPRRRPAVMGVVNCTPDSFSDGGRFLDPEAAVAHAERLLAEGADLLDIGGESTRPGAEPVPEEIERERVLPVVSAIRRRWPDAVVSVDTAKPAVAAAALEAGADLVNDVSGGADPEMAPTVARGAAGLALMHCRGTPRTMQRDTSYDDVVAEVHDHLRLAARKACAEGVEAEHLWLDPGIGFGKDITGNLRLLAALPDLAAFGFPVVVGASRKSFIGRLSGGASADHRLPGSLAALIPTLALPRAVVRVHDVAATVQFLEVATRLAGG